MKSVLKRLAKSVLIQLGLIAAASEKDAAIHQKKCLDRNFRMRKEWYYEKS